MSCLQISRIRIGSPFTLGSEKESQILTYLGKESISRKDIFCAKEIREKWKIQVSGNESL